MLRIVNSFALVSEPARVSWGINNLRYSSETTIDQSIDVQRTVPSNDSLP